MVLWDVAPVQQSPDLQLDRIDYQYGSEPLLTTHNRWSPGFRSCLGGIIQILLAFGFAFLMVVPFMIALGFPLLFQMKVNGMIAKHFS